MLLFPAAVFVSFRRINPLRPNFFHFPAPLPAVEAFEALGGGAGAVRTRDGRPHTPMSRVQQTDEIKRGERVCLPDHDLLSERAGFVDADRIKKVATLTLD